MPSRYAVRFTANPQATEEAEMPHELSAIATGTCRLDVHRSQQQTLKSEKRLRGCIDSGQTVCSNAAQRVP